MSKYLFEFNLETGKVSKNTMPDYSIRYYKSKNGIIVEIGDGYRHTLYLSAKHWNRILKIIKDDELDKSGIKAITRGLMKRGLPEKYENNLISATKTGIVKEIK